MPDWFHHYFEAANYGQKENQVASDLGIGQQINQVMDARNTLGGGMSTTTYPTAEDVRPPWRNVKIRKILNGYSVRVGCQELAFESAESLLVELKRYLKNPQQIEEEFLLKSAEGKI